MSTNLRIIKSIYLKQARSYFTNIIIFSCLKQDLIIHFIYCYLTVFKNFCKINI